ncbi:MAG: poly-gamma-glutamate synthase PgsB, partial [Anaerotruncus sp.]|nr:poly-gamma-glutamate synthase PgsB [Anaerotruncus sp.]
MYSLILLLSLLFFGWLVVENRLARHYRQRIAHVIHVNGTRGKSSVTRLIDAGLRAGGLRVFCKTTGTVPMTIGTDGIDRPIRRFGCANIREQLSILRQAAQSGAEVLVIECMAVDPAYQKVAQHRMLCADIGVITNVRLDHTDVMGETLPEIAEALSNTVPLGGVLFTAEQDQFPVLERAAQRLGTRAVRIRPDA